METQFDFGMIGLGTMGCNLLLNMADNHFAVIGFDINRAKAEEFEASANPGTIVKGVFELSSMIRQLKKPRKIMMLVPAGKPVDDVINNLLPLLEKDDIVIDAGNSHFTDTLNRIHFLQEKGETNFRSSVSKSKWRTLRSLYGQMGCWSLCENGA